MWLKTLPGPIVDVEECEDDMLVKMQTKYDVKNMLETAGEVNEDQLEITEKRQKTIEESGK